MAAAKSRAAYLRGDFRALDDVIKRSGQAAAGAVTRRIVGAFGDTTLGLNEQSLQAGTTPGGGKWAPRAAQVSATRSLMAAALLLAGRGGFRAAGNLARAASSTAGSGRVLSRAADRVRIVRWADGFKITLPAPYRYHQTGAHRRSGWKLRPRPLLVGRGRTIPKRWRPHVQSAIERVWLMSWGF